MEAFDDVLTALLGSQRSGIDIAVVVLALTFFTVALRGSKEIVGAFVGWFAARVRIMEERNQSCVLLAKALLDLQNGVTSIQKRLSEGDNS